MVEGDLEAPRGSLRKSIFVTVLVSMRARRTMFQGLSPLFSASQRLEPL